MYDINRLVDKGRTCVWISWIQAILLVMSRHYVAQAGFIPGQGPGAFVPGSVPAYDGFLVRPLPGIASAQIKGLSSLGYDANTIAPVGKSGWLLANTVMASATSSNSSAAAHTTSASTMAVLQKMMDDFRGRGFQAEPNYMVRTLATPNDPLYSRISTAMRQISAEAAWDVFRGSNQ
ncbi:hypothetical protein VOLCADRAFT_98801 [Volvox carteri f. nagariensis]|uniref:Uncharacterized protein n=1 Tax=Volvox carteri f. nagariensis TaxID=3068 RepID=D8UGB8_VOLCA|nr:uncharacterized protein VOLCADRAFT_98801 [Volvox carteri f. nagariensis]EFJ41232.1 hypothetical protein VOLCADRAFT_98801 [Volvox carteri f. nagariensis]|eukprot:XP_002957683.1 hypothetical protein VOLCADRAFT_98801 [Volvox carteri f. nagariensis]